MSDPTSDAALRQSPVHERHLALGAKMADFGGWSMPIEYPGGGVVREHTAVREAVGLFDVSHLGKAVVRGPGAADFLNSCLTNDLGRIEPGRAQYTLCCDDASGGVVDDLIAYYRSDDQVFLIPNAANTAEVVRRLQAAAPEGVEVVDLHERHGVLAVQGPRSDDVLSALGLPHGHGYMSFEAVDWRGTELVVCRTGYTGERGFELLVPGEVAAGLWEELFERGAPLGTVPVGLGARDTLRLEMGYALHGNDISTDTDPFEARLGWAVALDKGDFRGRDALRARKEAGPKRQLVGLAATDRLIPRHGMAVLDGDRRVGEVTSGTFSPTLRHGIALAYLLPDVAAKDTELLVDVRGRRGGVRVTRPPFVDASPR
jgi:aminomethyltransferase